MQCAKMACPGGCLGGGGQPIGTTMEVNKKRMESIYQIDKNTKYRKWTNRQNGKHTL